MSSAQSTIKTALVGFGNAGRFYHGPAITAVPNLQLTHIRETKEENIDYIRRVFPGVEVVADTDELFQNPGIDLVVIATPNATHASIAKKALLANKHVVVDKPFTINTEEADELIHLAEQQKKMLTVFHNRRFASDFLTVQKLLQEKKLGSIAEYEAHFDRFRPDIRASSWKEQEVEGAGILYDMGSHLVDQALVLFGKPQEVYGDLQVQRAGGKSTDYFSIVFKYGTLRVSLKGSMLVNEPRPQFAIYGDQGSFIKYGMDIQERDAREGLHPSTHASWGQEPRETWGKLKTETGEERIIPSEKGNFPLFYKNIAGHLLSGAPLAVTPQQARDVIKAIQLVEESNRTNATLKW